MGIESYSLEIMKQIDSGAVRTRHELNALKLSLCKKHGLAGFPSNPDILSFARKPSLSVLKLLSAKPVRSLSGIAIVAAMAKPHKCPGKCTYCPSGISAETPKSYTGREPATMRALACNFNPFLQAQSRIAQLSATGHSTSKLELIIMGGTFLSTPAQYQRNFVKRCIDACNGRTSKSLSRAKLLAEHAPKRITGITFETRPDFCSPKHISRMLSLGGTRVELGVQTLDDSVYKTVQRGHTVADVALATASLKDSAFKVCYHLMPGLPGSSPEADFETLKRCFEEQQFKPDMLKIYPCLVIEGTELYKDWKRGSYTPLCTESAVEVIAKMKRIAPRWVRIMRIQRDIPVQLVSAGISTGNLRQLVHEKLARQGASCSCIRCREAGLALRSAKLAPASPKLFEETYEASGGTEIFISAENKERALLYGFCRLRIPSKPFRSEITPNSALVRELRVFGTALALGEHSKCSFQHRSLGKQLLSRAEEIAAQRFGSKKIVVLSGIGVREYYRPLGYRRSGEYVSKAI